METCKNCNKPTDIRNIYWLGPKYRKINYSACADCYDNFMLSDFTLPPRRNVTVCYRCKEFSDECRCRDNNE